MSRSCVLSRPFMVLLWLGLLHTCLSGCKDSATTPAVPVPAHMVESKDSVRFETSAQFETLQIVYRNGEDSGTLSILESLGGGVAVVDYDLNGSLDLFFPGGGTLTRSSITGLPGRLIRQIDLEKFQEVTSLARVDTTIHFTHGCFSADYNADGFDDLLITGYGGVTLWRNLGDGTFEDATSQAGLDDDLWSTAAAWGDYNSDGLLDVYLTHYVDWSLENNPPCRGPSGKPDVCPPRQFEGLQDRLYFCQADGRFVDVTETSGLIEAGKGLGAISVDFDHDNDLDVYVANDTTPNFLYLNQNDGTFVEQGVISGIALDDMGVPNGSMGITVLDYNKDSLPDIGVTNYEGELFGMYQNTPEGYFVFTSRSTGVNQIGNMYVGFGCVADDFDADGDQDIAIANGHVVHFPLNATLQQSPLILLQDKDQQYDRADPVITGPYFTKKWVGRGLAKGDLNRDGMIDLIFVNTNQVAALLYNRSKPKSALLKHVEIELIGTVSNRNAIGARVSLNTKAGMQTRDIFGGGSYLSSSERKLLFHCTKEAIKSIEIVWPDGQSTSISDLDLSNDDSVSSFQVIQPVNSMPRQDVVVRKMP